MRSGAEYVLFADANVTFPFREVRDGDVLELGNVTVEVPAHARPHTGTHFAARHRSYALGGALVCPDRPYAHGRRSWPNRTCNKR